MKMKVVLLLSLLLLRVRRETAFTPTTKAAARRYQSTQLLYKFGKDPGTTPALSTITTSTTTAQPLVDVPLQMLKLPRFALGQGPVTMPLQIQGQGPFRFMVDTGMTRELIAPQLQDMIQCSSDKTAGKHNNEPQGIAAGGVVTQAQPTVEIDGFTLSDGVHPDIPLPTLQAMVGDFAQIRLDPQRPVAGMLGMDVLFQQFDVDMDFPAGRMRLWAPGTAAQQSKGMVEIPAVVLNESLLLGTRIRGKLASSKNNGKEESMSQPCVGIIDTGSTFSTINWEAAKCMGLPPKTNKWKYNMLVSPPIVAAGMDNTSLKMPTKKIQFSYCGNTIENKDTTIVGFESPPEYWKPWVPVVAGVGDLPVFELLLGSENKPFHGPAAIIGMDVLSQRRLIFEAAKNPSQRARRIFVSSQ
uniref:Peptidase A2 domain-containing protein n=1 Tax=Amphora coffeiformis TaxID=265554 RepID=A0A6S8JSP9_9STRA